MVEYRYDAARKRYWLMEVNGRYWGSLPLTRHCDTLFAWEAYRRSVLGQVVDAPVGRQDIIQARYMIPETKRLMRLLIRRLICPPLSGPETMIVWTTKGTMNAEQEAQAGRDYRQAA